MKIVVAPDKFKGSLPADQVAAAIAEGIRRVDPKIEIDQCPLADGGEGFVSALVAATGGRLIARRVTGPLPEMKVEATFGLLGDGQTAVIEMATASGLALLKAEERNPLYTTTFGTGELLNAAIDAGAKKIVLGIGGSATVDGGIGCAQATGHTIILEDGEPVSPTEPLVGADVSRVVLVKRHRGERTDGVEILVACDVENPLYGPTGAATVFGFQKGATPDQVEQLDASLRQLAMRNNKTDVAALPGAGAAGGLGFGMVAFFGASLRRGIDIVMEAVRLRERLRGANLCVTGEGKLDEQTLGGKTVAGVAAVCRQMNVPLIALAGVVDCDEGILRAKGISIASSIMTGGMTVQQSMLDASSLLTAAAARAVKQIVYSDRTLPNR